MKLRITWRVVRITLLWLGSGSALALLVLVLAGTFDERIEPAPPSAPRDLPPPGEVVEVERVSRDVIERSPGTVRPIRETVITARIVADVREVLVRAGDHVRTDDPLVLLDDRDLQALVHQTEEELLGAEARQKEADANFRRIETAAEKDAVSRQALDQAEAAKLSAAAAVDGLRQRLEQVRVDLSHATIVAPFDAVITDRYAYPGELASPERPLLRLYDPVHMRLEAYVRESLAIHLEVGQAVEVELETLHQVVEGTVEEVVPQAEAAARAFLVKVGIPEGLRLYPGMFGRLLLRSGSSETLLVPERSLVRIGQLTYVTLADARRTRRLVVPGQRFEDERIEILSGLEEGERILLRPGV